MKTNAVKCCFIVSTKLCRINNIVSSNKFKIKINEIDIEISPQGKLLGVILDDQLNFKSHMVNIMLLHVYLLLWIYLNAGL